MGCGRRPTWPRSIAEAGRWKAARAIGASSPTCSIRAFAELRADAARQEDVSAGDPWCIGYFSDNELSWGDEISLALAALASPPTSRPSRCFIADLKAKYADDRAAERGLGHAHASWEALRESRKAPDKGPTTTWPPSPRMAEQYFRTCRDEIKRVGPEHLYLGCRFAWVNDRALRARQVLRRGELQSLPADVADFRFPQGSTCH